jgi:uncharacterized protein with PhoU and TrkA domain
MNKELVKLKNITELMTDLAYSAVFLHDTKLAKQVHTLYVEMNKLYKKTRDKLDSMNISESDYNYLSKFLVYIKELATNAVFIAELTRHDKVPRQVKNVLAKTDKRVIEALVHYSSFFSGKKVGDLKLETYTKARIVCVKRNDEWIFDVNKNFVFKPNDLIIAVGTSDSERLLQQCVDKSGVV